MLPFLSLHLCLWPSLMVNFICQYKLGYGMATHLFKHYFWCFQGRLLLDEVGWVQQTALSVWTSIMPSVKDLNRTERLEEEWICSLPNCWAGTSVVCSQHSWFPDFHIWIRTYTISSLALRPLSHTPGYPRPPASRWQITGLLCLHNHVSQILIINLIIYTYISY